MPYFVLGSYRNNPVSELIAKVTGDEEVRHVSLYDSDRGFVSEAADGGVHVELWDAWRSHNILTRVVELTDSAGIYDSVRKRHYLFRDAPYDVPGLFRRLWWYIRLWVKGVAQKTTKKRFQDRAFFCSEWVVGILKDTSYAEVFDQAPEGYNASEVLTLLAENRWGAERTLDELLQHLP